MRRDIFQAIADPSRREILSLLITQSLTPNSLAEYFDTSRQAVSKHLQILTECNVIELEKRGREIYYHFNPKKLKEVDEWLEPFRLMWEERFSNLDRILNKSKSK